MDLYIWMMLIVLAALMTYNEFVSDSKDKVTWQEIIWMTVLAPAFIGVCLGILAADQADKK